ncbi:uncharacterized protein LOC111409010 isoform X3 [Olea europaea var. sylvestris]|uniref:uncharacterized protein LOC111409010 isoform X3 n=1 Tax=Olea europaea var. sylvestris TaxID=158386 RepID=UPI000C1D6B55|nr:uncharacterized protein LOC111409010 isoform X3 [Olea europaea var. sylvestris]
MPILFSPSTSPLHNFPWRFSSHSLSPLSTADHRRLSSLSSLFDFHRQPTAPQTSLLSLSAFHRHAHSHRSPPRTQIIKMVGEGNKVICNCVDGGQEVQYPKTETKALLMGILVEAHRIHN